MESREHEFLWNLGYSTITELEVESGILASGRDELYGCIFGRDSLVTALLLLRVYEKNGDAYFLNLTKKILLNLALLQGREVNIESGEEPGKIIHEFRPDKHEHLTSRSERPWYLYPDRTMKSYDSVDSTPLFLLAAHAYMRASRGEYLPVVDKLMPHIKAALEWLMTFADSDDDGLADYRFHESRTFGGLTVQSWMDSHDSAFHENEQEVAYPIAPVEVQGYAWAALKQWAGHFKAQDPDFAARLEKHAVTIKKSFREKFVLTEHGGISFAFAIDGNLKKMTGARSNIGHLLWASCESHGKTESVLEPDLIPFLAKRLMRGDLFSTDGGIRTLSTRSRKFHARSYHNGSIWPHDTEIIAAGFERFGYIEEASRIRAALFTAYMHFRTPIEFFAIERGIYSDSLEPGGQRACQKQAWSAAALLSALSSEPKHRLKEEYMLESVEVA